ncbi:MAG: DUF1598 domain-containing protein [Planctomycetales bacterium]|nr:DUF1598 domain-containing protein [Planctomycetales bacterium]
MHSLGLRFSNWFAFCHVCSYLLAIPPNLAADDPDFNLDRLIATGDVTTALQVVRHFDRHVDRDPWLAKISVKQADAGDRTAAIQTLGEIYDHASRWRALQAIAQQDQPPAQGGGAQADFEPILELITGTIQPPTWEELGGPGAVKEFPGGVYVDPEGLLQRNDVVNTVDASLEHVKKTNIPSRAIGEIRRTSSLRKISLPRLELQCQLLAALGKPPTEAMQSLAGLTRVEYVFVYPASGDLVIAGPAGDWSKNTAGIDVNNETGAPVLKLDDLVELLREMSDGDQTFGCSITPRQEALARTQAYLSESSKRSLRPGERSKWLAGLRDKLGRQDIKVWGLDPRCHAAAVLVEADYRMKLVGMGLEESVLGVTSYLDSVQVAPGQAPPPMDVLRWWFTLNYDAIQRSEDNTAIALRGQGVRVLSENELLTETGKRVHTGAADELNQAFAESFTRHFPALCDKYPIYAELRNVFDLALVAAIIESWRLDEHVEWRQTAFGRSGCFATAYGHAPKEVDTVINSRVINRVHIVAGVSGGVSANISPLVRDSAIEVDRYGRLTAEHKATAAGQQPRDRWWWD